MNCQRSREHLALHVSGDLPGHHLENLHRHLEGCGDCQEFYSNLEGNQTLLRSLRHQEVVPASALTEMRHSLRSSLEDATNRPPLWVRLERFFLGEIRRPRYVALCLGLVALVSATLFAQLRHVSGNTEASTVLFENGGMRLPENYRGWVLIGTSTQFAHSGRSVPQNIYLDPSAYREYKQTGRFPRGTVVVLESVSSSENTPNAVLASVKDPRFPEGWGYFQFSEGASRKSPNSPVPQQAACLACHRDRAATDHVFTQFYPVLRSGLGVL